MVNGSEPLNDVIDWTILGLSIFVQFLRSLLIFFLLSSKAFDYYQRGKWASEACPDPKELREKLVIATPLEDMLESVIIQYQPRQAQYNSATQWKQHSERRFLR